MVAIVLPKYDCVFGVLPMVPLVGNICIIGANGITIFLPFASISLPMVPLVVKLLQMVKMLPTNGTIGEPRTNAL